MNLCITYLVFYGNVGCQIHARGYRLVIGGFLIDSEIDSANSLIILL